MTIFIVHIYDIYININFFLSPSCSVSMKLHFIDITIEEIKNEFTINNIVTQAIILFIIYKMGLKRNVNNGISADCPSLSLINSSTFI